MAAILSSLSRPVLPAGAGAADQEDVAVSGARLQLLRKFDQPPSPMCPASLEKAGCLEKGLPDPDCCSMAADAGCAIGAKAVAGSLCHDNGAVSTCCPPKVSIDDGPLCPANLVQERCLENGRPDGDCCAAPGGGACGDGRPAAQGKYCHENGAIATCCQPTPVDACPSGHSLVGCVEKGEPDEDCCAMKGSAACVHGPLAAGSTCHLSGAVYTCCPEPVLSVLSGAASGQPSLYCWALSVHSGNEAELMRDHYQKKQSIFACQEWSLFSDDAIEGVPSIDVGSFGSPPAWWGSWYNAATFTRAWGSVIRLGVWMKHSWTAKVDPDTVWFPDRLTPRLAGMAAREPWYVRNTGGIMLGSIEVVSAGAVKALWAKMASECRLDSNAVGEDGWLGKCLDRLGVKRKEEPSLLLYSSEVATCGSQHAIAYHAFKDVAGYAACYNASAR